MKGSRPILENPFRLIVFDVLLLIRTAGILALVERQSLVAELEQQSAPCPPDGAAS